MEIFNDYTSSEVLFDIPYIGNKLTLYPIKVRDYKIFEQYTKLFLFSKKHYKLGNNDNLFEFVLAIYTASYLEDYSKKGLEVTEEEALSVVLEDFEKIFTIICREKIYYDKEKLSNGSIVFVNKDKTIEVSRNNFEIARQIVLKQNALREPKIFENITESKLGEKYIKSLQKKKGKTITELGEIANLISCVAGKSYDELYNQNVMQLYADYFRCASLESYKANILFMTVSDKVKPPQYAEEIISKLFSDPYDGMWLDKSSVGFLN